MLSHMIICESKVEKEGLSYCYLYIIITTADMESQRDPSPSHHAQHESRETKSIHVIPALEIMSACGQFYCDDGRILRDEKQLQRGRNSLMLTIKDHFCWTTSSKTTCSTSHVFVSCIWIWSHDIFHYINEKSDVSVRHELSNKLHYMCLFGAAQRFKSLLVSFHITRMLSI